MTPISVWSRERESQGWILPLRVSETTITHLTTIWKILIYEPFSIMAKIFFLSLSVWPLCPGTIWAMKWFMAEKFMAPGYSGMLTTVFGC